MKLTYEEAKYLADALTVMMRSENEGNPERQGLINLTYKTYPNDADKMLKLARAAAELTETIQSVVTLEADIVTGVKFGGQA